MYKRGLIVKCSFPLSNYIEIEKDKIKKFFQFFIHFNILKISKLFISFSKL